MPKGSLVVVGTGIRTVGQMTTEAIAWMRISDKVLYVVSDPIAVETIRQLNPDGAESLAVFYEDGKIRRECYLRMVDRILECVRSGLKTCVAAYGHPGVFTYPTHEAVRRAREEGFEAQMLPGISAEDCLFADLGIDPATDGCQSYEATMFLKFRRRIDPSGLLLLWQIGAVGDLAHRQNGYDRSALPLLVERLLESYPPDHEVCVYQAATLPLREPIIIRARLDALADIDMPQMATLCVPPCRPPEVDAAMLKRMGLIVPAEAVQTER